jgi:4-amino-4-deoxy-L-arabinose transferase-like glycosyltransferase
MSYLRAIRWQFWRSPAGQPPWARPALLAVAGLAGLGYAWGAGNVVLEPYYGGAARSMSESWHDFFFGAFDPAGTITVDKLPGALWPQALSLRLFGFHPWAVVLPQIVAGVLTLLVLYRAVRRMAGPAPALAAAVVLAVTPVTVALNRGNVADSLLILLTVLAADATCAAIASGRLRTLLLAAFWVGLAFQAKMAQAWLVLPALAAAYLVAAPGPVRLRAKQVALAGALTVVVSLSWMVVVSLVPAGDRPYVDGTSNNSVFSQVFDYNGVGRIGHTGVLGGGPQPAEFVVGLLGASETERNPATTIKASWDRLLGGLFGRDDGWFLPAALLAAVAVLYDRRRSDRRDPLRAGVLLWGIWLLVLGIVFSTAGYLNSYYVAALSPAIAALCGSGVALLLERRYQTAALALAALLLASVGYGAYLLHGGARVPGWLLPLAVFVAVVGAAVALVMYLQRDRRRLSGPAIAAILACALVLPVVTSVLVVTRNLGPFTAPYQARSTSVASSFSIEHELSAYRSVVDRYSSRFHTPFPFAVDSSLLAGPYIFSTGEEILPIGGYSGGVPAPSLSQIQQYVNAGKVRAFLVPIEPAGNDARIAWVRATCKEAVRLPPSNGARLAIYDCGQPA